MKRNWIPFHFQQIVCPCAPCEWYGEEYSSCVEMMTEIEIEKKVDMESGTECNPTKFKLL